MRGRALQLVKAVEDSNGLDAWKSLHGALKPTSKARGLALVGAATTWPAFSMNSALQPPLEEVFEETVKSGIAFQEELKSAILLRCAGGQLKSYSNWTIGDNVQYSTLTEQVLQSDRSRQNWATSMVASSSTDCHGPMPMAVDRVQRCQRKGQER